MEVTQSDSLSSLSNLQAPIPVRCFTCGKVLANRWNRWIAEKQKLAKKNHASAKLNNEHKAYGRVAEADILDKLGLRLYCCRRMFLTHPEGIVCAPKQQDSVKVVRNDKDVQALSNGSFRAVLPILP